MLGFLCWLPHPCALSVKAIPMISCAVSIEKFVRVAFDVCATQLPDRGLFGRRAPGPAQIIGILEAGIATHLASRLFSAVRPAL